MITEIPIAKLYKLCSIENPKKVVDIGDRRMCGASGLTFSQLLMHQIGRVMTDDDVVVRSGINTEFCMLIVKFPLKHIYEVLEGALTTVEDYFKQFPENIPAGGAYITRDWDDIPDSEKAGKKK